jgi:hypothetical protein
MMLLSFRSFSWLICHGGTLYIESMSLLRTPYCVMSSHSVTRALEAHAEHFTTTHMYSLTMGSVKKITHAPRIATSAALLKPSSNSHSGANS